MKPFKFSIPTSDPIIQKELARQNEEASKPALTLEDYVFKGMVIYKKEPTIIESKEDLKNLDWEIPGVPEGLSDEALLETLEIFEEVNNVHLILEAFEEFMKTARIYYFANN